ncbi:MAG: DUF499 domain-containing protein [Bacillota bacterium]
MLDLKLRTEFLNGHMRDTAIVFRRDDGTGALDVPSEDFFRITYPVVDLQKALFAISEAGTGKPVVLIGDRGRGKSHIMAALHHAIVSRDVVETWALDWGQRLGNDKLMNLQLPSGFLPVTEAVHNNEYEYLWDLFFDRHPSGQKMQGKFEASGVPVPARSLMEEMFSLQPTVLIVDEFQTWFDGLNDEPGDTGRKRRTWTFNFIQILSELSKDRPDIFRFIISVRNNQTDAYRQVHRDNPALVDFKGVTAKTDRKRLVLHRLFENRRNIPDNEIRQTTAVYAAERFRLLYSHLSAAEYDRIYNEVVESWPFAPELIDLLEDQILLSEAAQGSRDMIRVLAQIYKATPQSNCIFTPADYAVDNVDCGVQSLLDAISDEKQDRLREIAQRNLEAVIQAGVQAPNARGIISALWMRSISPGIKVGGLREELHLDITRSNVIDDNIFNDELTQIKENSFNIHEEEGVQPRLRFKVEENARAKLLASAKNDKLFEDGSDKECIRSTLRYALTPVAAESVARVIVPGSSWLTSPWDGLDENDQPDRWDRPVLFVLPAITENLMPDLGLWLKKHVTKQRNVIRYLLPKAGTSSIFEDKEIVIPARAALLGKQWGKNEGQYKVEGNKFHADLTKVLGSRYDRFAVLQNWDFQNPQNCKFTIEQITKSGTEIVSEVEKVIRENLFAFEDFEVMVKEAASNTHTVGAFLTELKEPPVKTGVEPVPYLGEIYIYEQILRVAASGKVYLNVGGSWLGKKDDHANDQVTLQMLRTKASKRGKELYDIILGTSDVVGADTVIPPPQPPTTTPPIPTDPVVLPVNGPGIPVPEPPGDGPTCGGIIGIPRDDPTGTITSVKPAIVKRSDEKTTLNLSGEFENWGLTAADKVSLAKLEFQGITVKEIKTLLQKLPPTTRAILEVTLPEGKD